MAQKAVYEADGKRILAEWIEKAWKEESSLPTDPLSALTSNRLLPLSLPEVTDTIDAAAVLEAHPWLAETKLVAKPDQLIKRRGKAGLLKLNASWDECVAWIQERNGRPVTVDGVTGDLGTFLVEPFVPHAGDEEYYICLQSGRYGDEILFHTEGGVDVGDIDSKGLRLQVPVGSPLPTVEAITSELLSAVPAVRQANLATFIRSLLKVFIDLNFVYMEINPLVVTDTHIYALDMAAKLDEAAAFLCGKKWGESMTFPPAFGRPPYPEEAYIRELDSKTGASLKLTVLNLRGSVWTMVAGGGASVVYADTIADLGFGKELANYGEYSGAPSTDETFEYCKTLLQLMNKEKLDKPKTFIIGGGIANFTDVAATFTGIIRALMQFKQILIDHNVTVWVRRGGPNCQEGLRKMRDCGAELGVPVHVYGPETHITAIVPLALGLPLDDAMKMPLAETETSVMSEVTKPPPPSVPSSPISASRGVSESSVGSGAGAGAGAGAGSAAAPTAKPADAPAAPKTKESWNLFTPTTRAFVYGTQDRAVQGMLDFDFLCKRERPSVAAMINPFSGNHYRKFYWGDSEVMMPVYQSLSEAVSNHSDVSVFINFASFRSVYSTTMDALSHKSLNTIAIIAEGVPEQHTRLILKAANDQGVTIIGPATVGGVTPGSLRIGNTGGMLDNIVACKLYRHGSVAYVSKSGGMSNELNNIISRVTDGVADGVAIGGDRYPGSLFIDHLLRFQQNPEVKMLVLLGEVGGVDEYAICEAIKDGRINKPVVAWCIGTCAKIFPFEVQFGHAGALANSTAQTADAKNKALAEAGAHVPENFNDFVAKIRSVFADLVTSGVVVPRPEPETPRVPMDYSWAKKLGLIRKPAAFVSTISDERGDELMYAGLPITEVFAQDIGLGGVISLLWFKRRLPDYATKFIEMILMVTADHGPAVSGAHNTIVTARAGKDLISSLVSGLLTIGPRFGGALDEAASLFSKAHDSGKSPQEFVSDMRKAHKLIMGIGHRVKSITNPDKRVTIVVDYAHAHFKNTEVLDYAIAVEAITTKKKGNLILNVDGAIAAAFVDMMRSCGMFTRAEADESVANGVLNGLFVLGRSVGLIGHALDQKRLKMPLYRHPWDDISYQMGTEMP